MKKWILCVLSLMMCATLLLVGCKISDTAEETKADQSAQTGQDKTVEQVTEAPASRYDETSPKTAEWFDSAVFVGDSVTLKLQNYCYEHPEALGNADFYCAGSLGYGNALWAIDNPEAVHPYYQGEVHLVEDCVQVTGKKNVFIMLGMNDIGLDGTQGAMDHCKQLIARLTEKAPDACIYLQSVTPMIESAQFDTFNNTLVKEFDEMLKGYCEENGYKYLDVYSAMADSSGNLPNEYCSDPEVMGLHFSDVACEKWAEYLRNNA